MKSGKTMRDIVVLMLMASLLAGCGSSPANSGGNSGGKETAAAAESSVASEIEAESGGTAGSTESEIETESEETAVNKESILKEADVDISVADAQVSDGQVGFTLYFSNTGSDHRSVHDGELLVNGTPVTDPVVEEHSASGAYSTTSSTSAYLEGGEECWSALTMQADDVKSGDTVRIDYEMRFNDGDGNTLVTKYLEFGITADGKILLGEDLEALNLAPSRNIEAENFSEVVFYDNHDIRIKGEGFTLSGDNERIIHLTVENNASFEVSVRGNVAVVDGYLINIGGSELIVPAGETASGEFPLNKQKLDIAGIHTIHEMALSWNISGEGIDRSEDPTAMVSVTTDKESVINERDTGAFKDLYNADGIVVKVDPQRYTDEWGNDHMYILWENTTGELLNIEDIVVHPDGGSTSVSADLYPDSKLWREIRVSDGDTFFVRARQKENWESIFESEHLTVE